MSKKPLQNLNPNLLTALLGVFAGGITFFCFYIPFDYFQAITKNPQLSFQIDPINLLSIFVNIILAIYVIRVLNRQDEKKRVIRNLLANYFLDFESKLIQGLHKMATTTGIEYTEVAMYFKRHAMTMQELANLVRNQPSPKNEQIDKLENTFSEIRELFSNTPSEGDIEDGIRIEDTKIFYSPRHLEKITTHISKLKISFFETIVCIHME